MRTYSEERYYEARKFRNGEVDSRMSFPTLEAAQKYIRWFLQECPAVDPKNIEIFEVYKQTTIEEGRVE